MIIILLKDRAASIIILINPTHIISCLKQLDNSGPLLIKTTSSYNHFHALDTIMAIFHSATLFITQKFLYAMRDMLQVCIVKVRYQYKSCC